MTTKHIFTSADGLVLRSLRGAVAANPCLKLHAPSKSVYVASQRSYHGSQPTVAVISGGGSGHEPAHAGYTGQGMLTASVSGDIFASPSAKQILHTIKLASASPPQQSSSEARTDPHIPLKDVLVIINNYTGDRLNFGLAIEKALVSMPIKIESVVVADDVSLLHSTSNLVGPRGLAGNILVCKILGAFAERGAPLASVKQLGDAVVNNLASVGVGLEHCHVPGRAPWGAGTDQGMIMGQDECEIGLGLHNEPGVTRKGMESPNAVIREMIDLIIHSKDGSGGKFLNTPKESGHSDDVILFVNNLGGMSQLEMGAVLDEILAQLDDLGIYPVRIYLSAYMTSLNAPGFSFSILNISAAHKMFRSHILSDPIDVPSKNITDLLDDSTDALAWIGVRTSWPTKGKDRLLRLAAPPAGEMSLSGHVDINSKWNLTDIPSGAVKSAITSACDAVFSVERDLTEYDTILGDGDCGETFSAGARAVLAALENGRIELNECSLGEVVRRIADVLEDSMGGTIGALFGIFFTALSAALPKEATTLASLRPEQAFETALRALGKHTPAKQGDRTLVDALAPFCAALSSGQRLEEAVEKAKYGAEQTRNMRAVLGRATYVSTSGDPESDTLPPDPGAWGVAAILTGFCHGLRTAQ
ncbi:Dak1 domain-containing protein [Collybia nuda]|uniref:Dak1 domain-containing protein n=1 Tax=Collybia nuda TaxID=64659 RepID=A0A9P5Y1T5_9AGAR|nr:Dak1 domain-containing protein [Collybia nuda]